MELFKPYLPAARPRDRMEIFLRTPYFVQEIITDFVDGTTTRKEDVACLFMNDDFALLKEPGGNFWTGFMAKHCPPWVTCIVRSHQGKRYRVIVWHGGDGRRVNKTVLAELITKGQAYADRLHRGVL